MEKDIVFIRNMILTMAFAVFICYNAHNTEALHNLADIKYIDDDIFRNEFGAESYLNRNADLFCEDLVRRTLIILICVIISGRRD